MIRISSLARRHAVAIHGVQQRVFTDRRERPRVLPFELDAQQVQHVAARQDLVQVVGHLDAVLLPSRARPAWTGRRRSRAHRVSTGPRCWSARCGCARCRPPRPRSARPDAPRDSRIVMMSSSPCVGMLVRTVPRVDHRTVHVFGQQLRRARRAVPHHHHSRRSSPRCSWPCR